MNSDHDPIPVMKLVTNDDGNVLFQLSEMHTHHMRFEQEIAFYHLLQTGNVSAMKYLLEHLNNMDLVVGRMSASPLRQARYTAIVLISVCTRVAISSGVEDEEAFSLSDETIQKIDKMGEIKDIFSQMSFFLVHICKLVARYQKRCYSRSIQLCLNCISASLYETITLEALAKQCHLSPNYLCSLFTKEVGISPLRYVKTRKLETAAALILEGKQSLSEISNLLGFSSQSHFTREFKAQYGCAPSQYYTQAGRSLF